MAGFAVTPPFGTKVSLCLIPCTSCGELAWATLSYLNLWAPHRGLSRYTRRLWAGNCCLRHPFSPVLEPRQGGDICSLAGLTCPHVIFSSNNVLLAVQAWGTPSAWRHVPRPPIRWVSSGRWVLSEPCQYIPCPLLPTISSRVFSARHNINECIESQLVRQSQIVQSVMQDCKYVLSHLLPVCDLLVQGPKITYNYCLSRRF